MSVGVVMTIRKYSIQWHRLAIPAQTAVLFGPATMNILSPDYLFIWSGTSGGPAKILILKLVKFAKFAIEDMQTFVAASVSCHTMIVECSYGGKR